MQEFIVRSIKRATISSDPIDYYREASNMIFYLKKKYSDAEFHLLENLGMNKKDIDNCNFSKESFRRLLDLYIKETKKKR